MQLEMSFTQKANAVAKYQPMNVERVGNKLWFSYINNAGSAVPAFYDYSTRSFKSVVEGGQYHDVAVRNVVARPVIDKLFQGV